MHIQKRSEVDSMKTSVPFIVSGLPEDDIAPLFGLTDAELAARGARKCIVDEESAYPCRVSLVDANVGETVMLTVFPHHSVSGPYQGTGPIYVRQGARRARLQVNEVPEVVRKRLMSVRAYDDQGTMVASEVVEGRDIEKQIEAFFAIDSVRYLHLHNARPGCYSCRVDRA
ncbi:MAG TPA: DUF1203 domain-containing protein, partial [Acidobacteriota bacterium]|nr:DUF1203 domain-containing protein [Acidobacteriota bacterium]